MTKKKKKVSPLNSKYSAVSFKIEETVVTAQPKSVPVNLAEEKARFIKTGLTPRFQVQDPSKIEELASKTKNQIRFDLQGEAEYILELVRDRYGDGELFLEHAFGSRITKEQATPMVLEYINENSLSESLKIHWCDSIACSAKMVWKGPGLNANKPELRKYSLWINWSDENNYMRESGIKCLMDHEIGTHFFRLINDGFQPWFSDRTRFDLRSMGSFEGQCTEEGLASIHTSLRGRVRLLWSPALAYYTACKAAEMSFKELFDHLGRYTSNIDFRWKQVMRVKRGLADPRDLGGFGNDQCYFEGAVKILRNMDNIDFHLLMSGKICMDEVDRIKRVVRKDVLRFPSFMKNMNAYRRTLKKMLVLNGLDQIHFQRGAPAIFTKRLQERKYETGSTSPHKSGSKKVRSKPSKSLHNCKFKVSANTAALKKHAVPENRKGEKNKSQEKLPSPEVERFPVSNNFANNIYVKQGEIRLKEQEARTAKLEQDVRDNIASLECDLKEHMQHLHNIVRDHTWSNTDSRYRDSLISEASSQVLEASNSWDITSEGGRKKCNSTLSLDRVSNSESSKQVGRGSILEDCGQPEKETKKEEARKAQAVSSRLTNLKLLQMKTTGSMFDRTEPTAALATARSKLASKKATVPLPAFFLVNSLESHCQSVSPRSEVSTTQTSASCGSYGKRPDKEDGEKISVSLVDKGKSFEENPQCGGGDGKQNKSYLHSADGEVSIQEITENCLKTEIVANKRLQRRQGSFSKKMQGRMLHRELFDNPVTLKLDLPFDDQLIGKPLKGPNNSVSALDTRMPTETTLVKFRMPKLQTGVPGLKSLQSTDRSKSKAKLFVAESSGLSERMSSERQLAGLKLASLANKSYNNCCVDVSSTCVESPLLISQPFAAEQV
ncbi:importin subunit alpha-1-like [Plakobranchus ocellatus]|uniref:Importin subunit alpha-1-like n=1 Tax=Plakobranchus ocellatus TaxID=259542 RepID=A0AAV4A8D7_9GAST|nr:importin subunit alpha-1-like [Plakobranchus ocellatus]